MIRKFIPMAVPVLGDTEKKNVLEAIESNWISAQGPFVKQFEEEFGKACGTRQAVSTSSGTTALHLALVAAGIKPKDEVLVPGITHIATVNAVTYQGAIPRAIDCNAQTWGIDPARIEKCITPFTRAIIVVHLYGHPCDMDPICEIAHKHNLVLIEDAAEAHGALYRGKPVGSLGDVACFSFFANKMITTGEGGMLVTGDPVFARRAQKLRDQAYETERRFKHFELGYNYLMTNIQAGIGLGQLERLDAFIQIRRRNALAYRECLQDIPGVVMPVEEPWARNVYWMFSLLVEDSAGSAAGTRRDELMAQLKQRGIDSRPFFYPTHLQPLYKKQMRDVHLPVSEKLGAQGINLPSGNELTLEEVEYISEAIRDIL